MDLQHQCLPAVGEAVDQCHSPQRAAAVKALGHEVRPGGVEFLRPTRFREHRMSEMTSEIEMAIRDQHGVRETERDGNDPAPERRELVKPSRQVPAQVLQGQGSPGARAKQPDSDALHRMLRHLEEEEQGVRTAEPAHR